MPSSAKPAIFMNVVDITAREETVITLDWSAASAKAICGGFWTESTPRYPFGKLTLKMLLAMSRAVACPSPIPLAAASAAASTAFDRFALIT